MTVRRNLYKAARVLGDVEAAQRGPTSLAKRVALRRAYRLTGGATRRLLRSLGLSR